MTFTKRMVPLCLVALAVVFAAACPKRVAIADIEADPQKYNDKTVAVAGVVKDSYGIAIPIVREGGGIYKIDDGTGSIWVMTRNNRGVPVRDSQIGVKGKVRTGVVYNGRNYGLVLMEDDRKVRKN
ncbi:MAG: hypothetical protein J5I65_18680 [Aridibacter famidurans]|nr:hypothetical protein [Aridibacter famidurans]